jgi:hypothetical protein
MFALFEASDFCSLESEINKAVQEYMKQQKEK